MENMAMSTAISSPILNSARKDINRSIKHTFLDFGDDDFTNGKPHPMIDPTNRISRLIEEARDPEVAVIVMDFVLGLIA